VVARDRPVAELQALALAAADRQRVVAELDLASAIRPGLDDELERAHVGGDYIIAATRGRAARPILTACPGKMGAPAAKYVRLTA
jgi:hypothetical protein